jgi:hypothetical protein
MLAGVLGLALSLAGLVGVWLVFPNTADYVRSTFDTLGNSVSVSQSAMDTTGEALAATVASVDALSVMLTASAASVGDTAPVLEQVHTFMADQLPTAMESASSSLKSAQQGAMVLDSAIQSLDTFRFLLSATPVVGTMLEAPLQAYDPEIPMADSLGELATSLETLPAMLTEMAANLDSADDNLLVIQSSLTTMADSVSLISGCLSEYKLMVAQSRSSMDDLRPILTNLEDNLPRIMNGAAVGLTLIFLWLLAAQVVILSQGWELFQGTAGRTEG